MIIELPVTETGIFIKAAINTEHIIHVNVQETDKKFLGSHAVVMRTIKTKGDPYTAYFNNEQAAIDFYNYIIEVANK